MTMVGKHMRNLGGRHSRQRQRRGIRPRGKNPTPSVSAPGAAAPPKSFLVDLAHSGLHTQRAVCVGPAP